MIMRRVHIQNAKEAEGKHRLSTSFNHIFKKSVLLWGT